MMHSYSHILSSVSLCFAVTVPGTLLWLTRSGRLGRLRRREVALAGAYRNEVMLQPGLQESPEKEQELSQKRRNGSLPSAPDDKKNDPKPVLQERRQRKPEPHTALNRVLIVGAGSVGRTLARSLQASGEHFVVGFVDDGEGHEHAKQLRDGWKILGSREDTERLVAEYGVNEVILAYAPTWQHRLVENLSAKHPEVSLRVVPSYYDALMRLTEIECHNDIALIRLTQSSRKARDLVKRTFDLLVAIFGLILTSPFLLLSILLIKATSKGPAIFAQQRIGYNGQVFTLYKLRTMISDAEKKSGPVLATGTRDSRLTPLGKYLRKFRLDEIPQLWNVLRGEMSLVGPRPERPFFVQQFEKKTPSYAYRHQVRPGITGLAQVCGGYHTDARDKLRFDLIYVSYNSLWLDFTILWKTVSVIVIPQKSGLDK